MKKRISILLAVIFMFGALTACSSKSANLDAGAVNGMGQSKAESDFAFGASTSTGGGARDEFMDMDSFPTSDAVYEGAEVPDEPSLDIGARPDDKDIKESKKVYFANVSMQTKDIDEAIKTLYEKIESTGSYVEDENRENWNSYDNYYRNRYAHITVRIPSEKFESFLSEIEGENIIITGLERSMTDYSTAYYDKESRVNSLKIQQERLWELLSQASDVEVMLKIENSLTDVRYEIESLTKELKTIDSLVSYSTINISLEEVGRYTPTQNPKTFGERISLAFDEAMKNFKEDTEDFAVDLIYNWPYIIVWAVIIIAAAIIVKVIIKKRKANHKLKTGITLTYNTEIDKDVSQDTSDNEDKKE